MNYEECREWLEERRQSMGSVLGLDEVNKLLDLTERPDEKVKIIHIAGTNGKGSVGYLLEQILVRSRIRTGRFLSPAVVDEREIILVDGKMVYKTIWAEKLSYLIDLVEKNNLMATAFEIELVLSLLIFCDKKCDTVIMECGMGGRLDATNACHNDLVDIITSISFDHRNFLGEKLEDISLHKFGIIKDASSRVVIAPQKKDVIDYFKKFVKENTYVNLNNVVFSDYSIGKFEYFINNNKIFQQISYKNYVNLNLSLAGSFQQGNAITVLDTVDVLNKTGYSIKMNAVVKAFENAFWPGRFETIQKDRLFILDGAHNPDAVDKLMNSVKMYFPRKKFVCIIGMYKDKDYKKVINDYLKEAKAVVTVTARDRKRAVDAFELGKEIREVNENVTCADSYNESLEIATLLSDKSDIILVFGSLSFLGEMRELINKAN